MAYYEDMKKLLKTLQILSVLLLSTNANANFLMDLFEKELDLYSDSKTTRYSKRDVPVIRVALIGYGTTSTKEDLERIAPKLVEKFSIATAGEIELDVKHVDSYDFLDYKLGKLSLEGINDRERLKRISYSYDKRVVERITDHTSIDTSPSYSPDGKYICFNSDRSGLQQIYVMRSDGSNVKRITFGKGLYGTPVWSPRGDLIAFTKVHQGRFYIGVMRSDGSGERLLTENFYQEAPSWSPNGRVLIFYRETKTDSKGEGFSAKLWSIDLTGYNERIIETETDGSDPSWSSLLSK